MKIYVLKMQRWGDYKNHSYISGIFNDPYTAQMSGKLQKINRGSKYYGEVLELEIPDGKTSVDLDIYYLQSDKYSDKNSMEVSAHGSRSKGIDSNYLEMAQKDTETYEILEDLGLSDSEIMELHESLSWFSPQEQVFFRNWYMDYINKNNLYRD